MRLWSLHPQYLDRRGLVALWREALLAQKVLTGRTVGYRRHPQLQRFRAHPQPDAAIGTYLRGVLREAERRGYRFDAARISCAEEAPRLEVTSGQLMFEWSHLMKKLHVRQPEAVPAQAGTVTPIPHPLFQIVDGPRADWERGKG